MEENELQKISEKYVLILKYYRSRFIYISNNLSKDEDYTKKNFMLLAGDLDFLIFIVENYPNRMNMAARFFLERLIQIRYYIATSGNDFFVYLAKKALTSWKKRYDFYKNIILPKGKDSEFVADTLTLCKESYSANIKLLEENSVEVNQNWKDIESVSLKVLKNIPIKNTVEQKLFNPESDTYSKTLSGLYERFSETSHPNPTVEISRISENQDLLLIALLIKEIEYFEKLSMDYFKIPKPD